ncbi:MAG: hypothetical protein HY880_00365 [Deltaproteobacteria bacterium]|nr:hypothetical protein [Deltaproteobacteria bacterium]
MTFDGGGISFGKRLRTGDLFLGGSTPRLYYVDDFDPRRPNIGIEEEGMTVRALNLGPLDENGMAGGVDFVYKGGTWTPMVPKIGNTGMLNADADFTVAKSFQLNRSVAISVSKGGTYEIEHLNDGSGLFMRITATSDADYLVVNSHMPEIIPETMPVTLRAQIRTTSSAIQSLHMYDWKEDGDLEFYESIGSSKGDWQTVSLMACLYFWTKKDYYAFGLVKAKKGDYFDIREFGLIKGYVPPVSGEY